MSKYLTKEPDGRVKLRTPIEISVGTPSGTQLVRTKANGKLDPSLLELPTFFPNYAYIDLHVWDPGPLLNFGVDGGDWAI